MSSFGKKLEELHRRLRPHVHPAYRRAYRSLMARGMSQRRPGEPVVCLDFSNPAIDAVGGRYYFSLVLDLIDAGYFPVFIGHRSTVSTFGKGRVKPLLLEKRMGFVKSMAEIGGGFPLITDSEEPFPGVGKKVCVDYEWRIASGPDEIAFPVFVHPRIAVGTGLPFPYDAGESRPVRIFFGGNTEEGKYDKNVIGEVYGMLTRREMLEVARVAAGEERVHRPRDAAEWLASREPHPFVLCETQHCRIPGERWLEAMSKGDFFLACPGVGMPLCHNLVEAMAAGAVPILQYSRYLTPELEDGVSCLAFHDADSLGKVVSRVLAMDREEIAGLRRGTKAYYDAHLAPGRFAAKLLQAGKGEARLLLNDYRVPR